MKLTNLSPFSKGRFVRVVIETPKGSRNKFDYDPDEKLFILKKLLPQGMVFPYDFGFIPRTEGEDGDPLDILVLLPDPVPPGTVVDCRLVGVMRATQIGANRKPEQNDRFIGAIPGVTEYESLRKPRDLPHGMLAELEEFFINYNKLEGRKFKILSVEGPKAARQLIKAARKKSG
jgi:inorganic pyrophosphatase